MRKLLLIALTVILMSTVCQLQPAEHVDAAVQIVYPSGGNDTATLQSANDNADGGIVELMAGEYNVSDLVIDGCTMQGHGQPGGIYSRNGTTINVEGAITLKRGGRLQGVSIYCSDYDGVAVCVDASDASISKVRKLLSDVQIYNTTSNGTGLLILCNSDDNASGLTSCTFGDIHVTRFEYGCRILCQETNHPAYINSNNFSYLNIIGSSYPFSMEVQGAGLISSNIVDCLMVYGSANGVDGITLDGNASDGGYVTHNIIDSGAGGDWDGGYLISLNDGAYENQINGVWPLGDTGDLLLDQGYGNSVQTIYHRAYSSRYESPQNLLENPDCEHLGNWTVTGIDNHPVITLSANSRWSDSSLNLTCSANGTRCGCVKQAVDNYEQYLGMDISSGVWIYVPEEHPAPTHIKVMLYDGAHSGTIVLDEDVEREDWHWVATSFKVDEAATTLELRVYVNWGTSYTDASVLIDGAMMVQGISCPAFTPN